MEIVIILIIGFALGYAIREWMSRKRRQAERERRGLPMKKPPDDLWPKLAASGNARIARS